MATLDSFTTRDGLIHGDVAALYQEPNGYLWVGTRLGLCRFDGVNFDDLARFENAPSGSITGILGDDKGNLWVLTNATVHRFQEQRFEPVFQRPEAAIRIYFLDSHGRLWVDTSLGLFRFGPAGERHFTVQDGLPDRRVTIIFEDKEGRLWFGFRNGGLARFEEHPERWQRYGAGEGLPHENVNTIMQTSQGRIWIATHGGMAWYEGGRFREAPFNYVLPTPIVYSAIEDNHRLWFNLHQAGVARWDGESLTVFNQEQGLVSDMIIDLRKDHTGRIWFTSNQGISIFDGNDFFTLNRERGLSANKVNLIHQQQDGLMWIGTSRGLNRFEDSRLRTFLVDPTPRAIPRESLARRILRDSQGNLWFPSLEGLGSFNHDRFRLFNNKDGLPASAVHHFLEDHQGRIWAGTDAGVAVLEGTKFTPLANPILGAEPVVQLMEDYLNRIWILDKNHDVWVLAPNQDPDGFARFGQFESVLGLYPQQNGHMWISTSSKLIRYDRNLTEFTIADMMPGEQISARYFDGKGTWWFGTLNGAYRFDGASMTELPFGGNLTGHAVLSIFPGQEGEIWFGTALPPPGFLSAFDYTGLVLFDGQAISRWDKSTGLLSNRIRHVLRDEQGATWFFSDKGLTKIGSRFQAEANFQHLTVAQGLAGNQPYDLLWDDQENLWIATNGGLNKYRENLMTSLSERDGLLASEVFDIEFDRKQGLWIRTSQGVQRYYEHTEGPDIELAAIFDGERPLPLENGLVLAHHQNDLIFHVSGIHLRQGAAQMQYAYNLVGTDNEWSAITRESVLHFPGLQPGKYNFFIKAFNRDLYASSQPVLFSFTIRPPFWLRTWFLAINGMLALLIGYMINRLRLGQKLEQARVVNELMTAHDMQMGLMPKAPPRVPGYSIFGVCEPAREVGGDFWDYFWLNEERDQLGLAIIDVSGKSMEAAIIAVMTSGLIYGEIGHGQSPAGMMAKINYPMFKKTGKKIFTTGILAFLDLKARHLSISSAGHLDPILIRGGKNQPPQRPARRDLPLGVKKHWRYAERYYQLEPGDLLLFYTDGLNEAYRKDKQMFGDARIIRFLETHFDKAVEPLVKDLLAEIKSFTQGAAPHDDITIIALRVD